MRYVIHNYLPARDHDFQRNDFPQVWAQAHAIDPMRYLKGLSGLQFIRDGDKWNADYSPDDDIITIRDKFHSKSFMERVQVLLHEAGHRGQMKVDIPAFEEFKRRKLNKLSSFLAMANKVHQEDYRENGIDEKTRGDEIFAESYARFALGLPMPDELKQFWESRMSARDAKRWSGINGRYDPAQREYTGREPVAAAIKNHPGVQEAEISPDSDYKYEVFLKEGWVYENGRMAGIRTGFFHNVTEFRRANPIRKVGQ